MCGPSRDPSAAGQRGDSARGRPTRSALVASRPPPAGPVRAAREGRAAQAPAGAAQVQPDAEADERRRARPTARGRAAAGVAHRGGAPGAGLLPGAQQDAWWGGAGGRARGREGAVLAGPRGLGAKGPSVCSRRARSRRWSCGTPSPCTACTRRRSWSTPTCPSPPTSSGPSSTPRSKGTRRWAPHTARPGPSCEPAALVADPEEWPREGVGWAEHCPDRPPVWPERSSCSCSLRSWGGRQHCRGAISHLLERPGSQG